MLVEGFGKRFAEPFQAWGRRSILEGNHDHSLADLSLAWHSLADDSWTGGGSVLGAKRRAEKQRNQKDENGGAFHDKLIISAGSWRITRVAGLREQPAQ